MYNTCAAWFCSCLTFDNELDNADLLNTPLFIPPVTQGKVIKVYDGDTITIASRLPYPNTPVYKFNVRLLGIDCPELKGSADKEKELAILARDALRARIYGRTVTLKNVGTEKYGRLLANVYLNGENLNEWMISNNYAIKYDGKTKTKPSIWI